MTLMPKGESSSRRVSEILLRVALDELYGAVKLKCRGVFISWKSEIKTRDQCFAWR